MALQSIMSAQDMAATAAIVEAENRRLTNEYNLSTTSPEQTLGKDDFLRILLTQLAHQDPTAPMQDREFIAQMAQFSSLEAMTNMAADFTRMANMLRAGEAVNALGKNVEIFSGESIVQGPVQAVTRDEMPQILVNGRFYNWDQVSMVFDRGDD
ncbi:MAG: flagellar hook assembly protein FlgD [Treponema sp.]|nr:flagellar hook assembly protein FlgD [Treponema sp.]